MKMDLNVLATVTAYIEFSVNIKFKSYPVMHWKMQFSSRSEIYHRDQVIFWILCIEHQVSRYPESYYKSPEFYFIHMLLPWMEISPRRITVGQYLNIHSTEKQGRYAFPQIPFHLTFSLIYKKQWYHLSFSLIYKKNYSAYFLLALFFFTNLTYR